MTVHWVVCFSFGQTENLIMTKKKRNWGSQQKQRTEGILGLGILVFEMYTN